MNVRVRQALLGLAHTEPGDAFQRLQVDDSIAQSPSHRLNEHGLRHFLAQGKQLA